MSVAKTKFRYIREGQGGTFPMLDNNMQWIGTYKCMSCVGLYFIIDSTRCFVAHMNGQSAVTSQYNMVTSAASQIITNQVVNRLLDFVRWQDWDVSHPDFGKDMILQCPLFIVPEAEGEISVGQAVFHGVSRFLEICGLSLEEMVEEREKVPKRRDLSGFYIEKTKIFMRETTRLSRKAASLTWQASHVEVDRESHGFLINHETKRSFRLHVRRLPKQIAIDEPAGFDPCQIDLPKIMCMFGVEEDDVTTFEPKLLASTAWKAKVIRGLRYAHYRYVTMGGKIRDPKSDPVQELLQQLSSHSSPATTSKDKATAKGKEPEQQSQVELDERNLPSNQPVQASHSKNTTQSKQATQPKQTNQLKQTTQAKQMTQSGPTKLNKRN